MASARPNILPIMTDEERYPPVYETDAVRHFRSTELPGQQAIRALGTELHRHYAAFPQGAGAARVAARRAADAEGAAPAAAVG